MYSGVDDKDGYGAASRKSVILSSIVHGVVNLGLAIATLVIVFTNSDTTTFHTFRLANQFLNATNQYQPIPKRVEGDYIPGVLISIACFAASFHEFLNAWIWYTRMNQDPTHLTADGVGLRQWNALWVHGFLVLNAAYYAGAVDVLQLTLVFMMVAAVCFSAWVAEASYHTEVANDTVSGMGSLATLTFAAGLWGVVFAALIMSITDSDREIPWPFTFFASYEFCVWFLIALVNVSMEMMHAENQRLPIFKAIAHSILTLNALAPPVFVLSLEVKPTY